MSRQKFIIHSLMQEKNFPVIRNRIKYKFLILICKENHEKQVPYLKLEICNSAGLVRCPYQAQKNEGKFFNRLGRVGTKINGPN